MIARFATAGVPAGFKSSIYKGDRKYFFQYLKDIGLNAYEVQCTYGFENKGFSDEDLINAQKEGIALSVHAPYYINLGSLRPEVQQSSINILKQGISIAKELNINRIIFHPGGGYGKGDVARAAGILRVINNLKQIENDVDMGNVRLYPEIGGKQSSLGSLNEIMQICKEVECCSPCLDLAHLHARETGSLGDMDSFLSVFDKIAQCLGREELERCHYHVYTIFYTDKGESHHLHYGEINEQTIDANKFLDDFIDAIKIYKLSPYVVSEAKDTQDVCAQYLMKRYNR